MNRYMAISGHDCLIPSQLIDTLAPIDVLHDAAAFRIRAATQLLENFAADTLRSEPAVLQELTLLRDGCDLLDVTSRRLQPQALL